MAASASGSYNPSPASLPNGRPRPQEQNQQSPAQPQASSRAQNPSMSGAEDFQNSRNSHPRSVNDAVSSAFDHSNAARSFDPALFAQMKAEILDELKAAMLSDAKKDAAPPAEPQMPPHSPISSVSDSIPPRYTPPSPERQESNATPKANTQQSETYDGVDWRELPTQRYTEPTEIPGNTAPDSARPKPPMRTSTGDATTLEKIWQPLFDTDGKPTPRLSQVLRGLALNLIEDYQPSHTLVISPTKMLRFYTDHRVNGEVYPFDEIFRKMSSSYISHLYRDLRCEHHFVQATPEDKPSIPALTPSGFDCWMTHFIRAHPDIEFERLSKAIRDLPTSNADDRKERFPKEVSRRLFPKDPHIHVQGNLIDCVTRNGAIQLSRQPSTSQAPPSAVHPQPPPATSFVPPSSIPRSTPSAPPQNRNVYPPSSTVFVDEHPLSTNIERERKPYSAQPGGGKVYDDGMNNQWGDVRHGRASTVSSGARPPMEFADEHPGQGLRHVRTGSTVDGQRPWTQRSPSRNRNNANQYTRSDTDVFSASYGSNGGSNLHIDDEELARRYSRDDRSRRYAEDDNYRNHPLSQSSSQSGRPHEEEYYRRGTIAGDGNYSNQHYPPPPPRF